MKKYIIGAVLAAASAIIVIRAQEPPADAAGLVKAGDAAMAKRNLPLANQYYAQAVALGDSVDTAPALYQLGMQSYRQSNYLAAEGLFQRLLAIDPAGPQAGRALTWLGNIKARDPQTFADAESLYQKALAVEAPNSLDTIDTLRNLAALQRRANRPDEAAATESRFQQLQTGDRAAAVYRVGDGIAAPMLIYKTEPQYTEEARAAGISGTTVLYAEIGTDGLAHNFHVQRSLDPGLDQQAIAAVSQWQFKPGQKDGAEVTVASTIEINWKLK